MTEPGLQIYSSISDFILGGDYYMKKIIGFQNKGGIRLAREIIYDNELVAMIGKKRFRKLINELLLNARDLKLGKLVYYPIEDFLSEMEEIIDNSILRNSYRA